MATDSNRLTEIRIYGVSQKTSAQLLNIASHLGTDISHMLRGELTKFIESKPMEWRMINAKRDDYLEMLRVFRKIQDEADERGVTIDELLRAYLAADKKG